MQLIAYLVSFYLNRVLAYVVQLKSEWLFHKISLQILQILSKKSDQELLDFELDLN